MIFVNTYALNIEAPKYMKQILTHLKGESRQQYNNSRF